MSTGSSPPRLLPLVSVIVPTRNSARTLRAALESVRRQGYPQIELLVVDNQSDDDTPMIAESIADRVFTRGPERSAQRNFGAAESSGEYLLFLDSDMILGQEALATCIDVQQREGAAAVVVPERTIGNGFWASVRALERSCYVGDSEIEAARFFTRTAFVEQGGYDVTLAAGEDWDLPARMREAGEVIARAEGVWIDHDEGHVLLAEHLRKKFYYGRTLERYARRHPKLARRQFTLVRPAFVRHRARLVRTPARTASMLALKWAEMVAGAAGVAVARFDRAKRSLESRRLL